MPPKFERCRRAGGKIRTIKPKKGHHMAVCVRPKGGKGPKGGRTVAGEMKRTKGR